MDLLLYVVELILFSAEAALQGFTREETESSFVIS